jgi:uncharacterized membrane protein
VDGQGTGAGTAVLLLLAFLAEVAMLVGLCWAGWTMSDSTLLSWLLAILLPSMAAVVWGTWLSPKARHRLPTSYRWAAKVTLSSITLVLLLRFGPQPEAGVFAVLMWLAFLVSLPADRTLGLRSART